MLHSYIPSVSGSADQGSSSLPHLAWLKVLTSCGHVGRFGGLRHDWPESYFKAQQTRGDNLAGVFRQAMGQLQAQKMSRSRSILARMFPNSPLARFKSLSAGNPLTRLMSMRVSIPPVTLQHSRTTINLVFQIFCCLHQVAEGSYLLGSLCGCG